MEMNRENVIIRTSVIGILANILLAAFKAAVGMAAHSIAVLLDAVNNLSDALSSVITIVGTRLSMKRPDKKHPFGYGRIEYLSSMIVAGIVLYAGITSAVQSVKKIIDPAHADYSTVALMIIAVAVLVKLALGYYVRRQGKKVNSGALTASGSDALFDAILSLSVLISAVIYLITGISLEAYVGAVISIVIIKSGIEMMQETLNKILGEREDAELAIKVKDVLAEEPEIRGVYDLIFYNYGPDRNYASVHLELPDTMTVKDVDQISRQATIKVYQETGVILTGIGVYSYNTGDTEAAHIQNSISSLVMAHDWIIQIHGFYLEEAEKKIRFDVVIDFSMDADQGLKILYSELQERYPQYIFEIASDVDITATEISQTSGE